MPDVPSIDHGQHARIAPAALDTGIRGKNQKAPMLSIAAWLMRTAASVENTFAIDASRGQRRPLSKIHNALWHNSRAASALAARIGETGLDRLEASQRPTERLALLGVGRSKIQRLLCDADGLQPDDGT